MRMGPSGEGLCIGRYKPHIPHLYPITRSFDGLPGPPKEQTSLWVDRLQTFPGRLEFHEKPILLSVANATVI